MVFLLLVFFVYSFLSMSYHSIIPVNLPTAGSGEEQKDKTPVIIGVHDDGSISVKGRVVNMEQLRQELVSADPENGVLISGDEQADYKDVIDVCDTVRKSGIENFAFQVRTEGR